LGKPEYWYSDENLVCKIQEFGGAGWSGVILVAILIGAKIPDKLRSEVVFELIKSNVGKVYRHRATYSD